MSEPDLKGIDLSAWDIPEPPDDLADAVVARLGGTDITPAIPVEAPKKRSRALIIGGVAAAVVAVSLGVWTLVGSTERAAPTNGVVSAQFAQQLSLDGVTADLDVGANVQWTRDARTVHVQQRTGSAAWRIAADQRLVINAGASMVEANGKSSLRVEVKMNKVERIVGASAFAAAAIATVTVIVYDGKVTVENPKHERIVVAPGTTYTVEPPVEERTVGVAPPVTVAACNLDTCILDNWTGPCCAKYSPPPPASCDAAALKAKGLENVDLGQYAAALAQFEASLRCKQDPDVALLAGQAACKSQNAAKVKQYKATCNACDADALKDKGMQYVNMGEHAKALALFEQSLACKQDSFVVGLAFFEACNAQDAGKARQYYKKLSPAQQSKFKVMCIRNHIDPESSCDADALKNKGMEEVNMGEHAKALALFEQSLACKHDDYLVALAFMAACNAQDAAKARTYYGQLSPAQQSKYKMMCERNHVDLSTKCDADALKDSGMEKINEGSHAEALALFEQSMACKPDSYVTQLAFMSACNARNASKAREYWGQLSPAGQTKYKVICDRNNIDVLDASGDPKGYLQVFSKPAARIFIDGVDTGLTTPITGKALALTPGKHKVTYVIGQDRFTYFVQTKSGQTDTMTKDLQ